jgi:hypothetical protein
MRSAHRAAEALAVAALIAAASGARPARAADPTTVDCLSASESSLALRNQHQLRAARAQLLVCAHANCPADVRRECTRRVDEINTAIPTVVFEAKDAAGNDVSAVKVSMDGQPLVDRLEGTALSIDPGEHVFTFESPGQPTVEKKVVIREGEKDRRVVVAVGAPATGAAQGGTAAAGAQPTPGPTRPTSTPTSGASAPTEDSAKRTVGFIFGGVGLAGVGIGITMLVLASSLSNRSDQEDATVPGSGHSDHEAAAAPCPLPVSTRTAPASTASVRITPVVGSQRAGLAVSATF